MKRDTFHGILVNAAFKNTGYPEKYKIFSKKIVGDWILYGIEISQSDIENAILDIQKNLRTDDSFYSHFYNDETLIIVFNEKIFRATPHISSWSEAKEYGVGLGIIEEQLDFWPNRFQDEIHYFNQ